MHFSDSIKPHPGEAPLGPELGLIMLAIGALVFGYILYRLVREYRSRNRDDAPADDPSSDE